MNSARPRPFVAIAEIVLGSSLVLSACASRPGADVPPGGSPSGSAAMVLQVGLQGGFIAPSATLSRVPSFSLYADGTVITSGAQPSIYPAPALAPLNETKVTAPGMRAIVRAATSTGLDGPDRAIGFGAEPADLPSTVFTLVVGGHRHVTTVAAAGGGPLPHADPSVSAFLAFEGRLMDLRSWLPTGSVGPEHPYQPLGLRVFVGAPALAPGGDLHEPAIAWPLAAPPSSFGAPLKDVSVRCGVVAGSELAKLLPLVQRATQITPWTSAGHTYSLQFRPLLPGESGC